jgi:hypothetical protein
MGQDLFAVSAADAKPVMKVKAATSARRCFMIFGGRVVPMSFR